MPRVPGGDIKPEHLILIGHIAQDFGLYTKITGGQRIDLFGAAVDQLPQIWKRLVDGGMESGHAYGKAVRTVKSRVGSDWCRYGQQDSVQLAIDLELRYQNLRAPLKIKLGVSGCARECAEARGKDVGVIATETGWNLYVGGNGGMTPRHAQLPASDLDTETLIRYIDRFPMYYIRTADRLQRTAPWIESIEGGLDHVRQGRVRRLAGHRRRIRSSNGAACAELQVRMEGRAGGSGQAVAVRLLRQRPGRHRHDGDIHRARRAQSTCAHWHPAGPLMSSGGTVTLLNDIQVWTTACAYDHLIPGRGVGVLLDDGTQAALFRLDDGSVHAVGNVDPFSGAAMISRGIVGDCGGRATVQSPILKQAFALDDGCCLDDLRVSVPVYQVRVTPEGHVQIARMAA